MNRLLLGLTALIALTGAASASSILHISDTPTDPTNKDPVLISSQTQFFLEQSANQTTPPPITLYFLDFPGAQSITPTISQVLLNGVLPKIAFTQAADTGKDFTAASGDFYKFATGCDAGCANSLSFQNIVDAYTAQFGAGTAPDHFDVYKATIDGAGFVKGQQNDFFEIDGIFGKGTIIAPFAGTDTASAWTNVGLINDGPCLGCGPTPNIDGVPEPSTWAMMVLGFAGVGFMAYRRSRKDQGLALAAA